MVKFGRKFFFDKVYTKKNYTIPIIVGIILLIAIITTFIVTSFFKADKPKEEVVKVVFYETVTVEVNTDIPEETKYFKKIENAEYSDFEIIYPENLKTMEDTSTCEDEENTEDCKRTLVTSLGEYNIIIKSDKLKQKEKTVTLKVVDTTKPVLEVKDITINEGSSYKVADFIKSCNDNSKLECTYEFFSEDKDEKEEIIDYSKFTSPGEYTIKIIAKDSIGNISEIKEAKLTIKKKKTETGNKDDKETGNTKPKTCEHGDLKYSDSYVVATKVEDKECAISVKEAQEISNKAAIKHNQKLMKEIQANYLQNTIQTMNLDGEITYDISIGLVYNSSNRGVVGYYILSEARQTINGVTTTIAKYFVDEEGNRVWKVNALNLK